ncbi:MAG: hypothetical protein PUB10_00330 [Clostridiales bacterium]|nr:hypothetical protein [Clostridiales bacterium]
MKNKSKLKKIKEQNQKSASYPDEWFYLNEASVTPREIARVFAGEDGMTAQLWEEAGVVEIELVEAKSVDLEQASIPAGDPELDCYFQEHNIKTVFYVTIAPQDYRKAVQAMRCITKKLGGYFCGDTADFTPVVE